MMVALLHWHYSEEHLEEVKKQMIEMGAPTIKAAWMECWNLWVAFEGCHRIRAAKYLGIVPIFENIEDFEDLKLSDIGVDVECCEDDYLLERIVDDACKSVNNNEFVEFEEE
jgi:hypothetical protein